MILLVNRVYGLLVLEVWKNSEPAATLIPEFINAHVSHSALQLDIRRGPRDDGWLRASKQESSSALCCAVVLSPTTNRATDNPKS